MIAGAISMMRSLFLAAALAAGSIAAVRADISAVQHTGHGIIAIDAPTVRMVSAKVDITWGEPGRLAAVFVMDNESTEAADVQLGFPVSLPEKFRTKDGLDFTMTFDGVPLDRASVREDPEAKETYHTFDSTRWFHCRHRFAPGVTTVKVDTKLPATAAYRIPYRENLFYCIQTGAGWKGRIGSEEVAIHFPRQLRPDDIERIEPAGRLIKRDKVRWRFEDFEPEGGDHDIFLQFLHPCVLPILDGLRRQSAEAPHDLRKRLNLIRHLLGLCDARFDYPYPSERLTYDAEQEILATLRSDAERTRFQELFVWTPDGRFESSKADDWSEDEDEVTTMLSAAGYVERRYRSKFLLEGRELLAQFLREHPHNADAWNLALLHFVGPPGEMGDMVAFQIEWIKTALQNCPGNPTIRLWDAYGRLSRQRREETNPGITQTVLRCSRKQDQLDKQLGRRGTFDLRFKQRSYRYYHD